MWVSLAGTVPFGAVRAPPFPPAPVTPVPSTVPVMPVPSRSRAVFAIVARPKGTRRAARSPSGTG
ncbi:hypothetical protein GCM10027160_33580 [Streptomyces calidiresistens]